MTRMTTDLSMSEQGTAYRMSSATRVVNKFSQDGYGENIFSPPSSEDSVAITNITFSADTTATMSISGSNSEEMFFYLPGGGSLDISLSEEVPMVGEIGESFATSCSFTNSSSGNATSIIFGYMETDNR